MFGAFRLLLALLVVYTHLGPPHGASLGKHAVFGFYVLSGYLMTRVLNEVYRFDFLPYAANRLLRLYPLYFLVIAASTLAALALPLGIFDPAIGTPATLWQWAANLLLVPMADLSVPQLIPTSWSVAVEIVNYAILWLVVARSQRFAWIALAVSVSTHVWLAATTGLHDSRYFPWYAAALPFSVGAITYFNSRSIGRFLLSTAGNHWRAMTLVGYAIVLAAAFFVGRIDGSSIGESLFYFSIITVAIVVTSLADLDYSGRVKRLDRFLGDLAYPAFLLHIVVAALLNAAFSDLLPRSGAMFLIATPITLVMSAGLVTIQAVAVEPLRDRLRHRSDRPLPSTVM